MASPHSSPSIFASFVRWLRLKNYQYEVTFALYMLTPTEKLIFNSLLLSFISMFFVAAYVYLPDHVAALYSHIYYYWAGDGSLIADYVPSGSTVIRESNTVNLDAISETAKGPVTAIMKNVAGL